MLMRLSLKPSIDEQRRDAERSALPARQCWCAALSLALSLCMVRILSISYFADLMTANRDAAASQRMHRHKALVLTLLAR